MAIKVHKEDDARWIVYNHKSGKTADIVKIEEYGFGVHRKNRYRVDQSGRTVKSMIDHFQTARSAAIQLVKD